jgi:NADP-dependent alcohol dehydrogenase
MNNFEFKNPTKVIFGKDTIAKLSEEIPADAKVLLL